MDEDYQLAKVFLTDQMKSLSNLRSHNKLLISESLKTYKGLIKILDNDEKIDIDNKITLENDDLKEQINHFQKKMNSIKHEYPHLFSSKIKDLIWLLADMPILEIDELEPLNIPKQELITHTKDFFQQAYSENFIKLILSNEKKNPYPYYFFPFKQEYCNTGETRYDFYNQLTFIIVYMQNTITDVYTMGHEISHLIGVQGKWNLFNKDLLAKETIPILTEMILEDYNNQNRYYHNYSSIIRKKLYNRAIRQAQVCKTQANLFDFLLTTHNTKKRMAVVSQAPIDARKKFFSKNYSYDIIFMYIYSFLMATKLFYQYRDDAAKTIAIIDNLMFSCSTKKTISQELKVTPDNLMDNLHKNLSIHY